MYKTEKDVLYPNYPFNSIQDDPFNLQSKLETANSTIKPIEHPYKDLDYVNNKYTFLGVNTLFNNPGLGSELKLELETTGIAESRYTEVINHAKYQYIGIGAAQAAFCFSLLESVFDTIAAVNAGGIISAGVLSGLSAGMMATKIPGFYYDWLDIVRKLAPISNFAWYYTGVGNYSDYNTTNIIEGNTRRPLGDAQYLKQGIYTVKDGVDTKKINNFKREGSVYLNLREVVDNTLTNPQDYFLPTSISDNSRWYPNDNNHPSCNIGNDYSTISSYYSSIKNYLPNQYGQVDNIEYVDTGYNGTIEWSNEHQSTECNPIFGGDTFICRYSERRQFPFFIQDRVGFDINSDVLYNELGNVGYPAFFFSYPKGATVNGALAISSLYGDVVLVNNERYDYRFTCEDESTGAIWLLGGQLAASSAFNLMALQPAAWGALLTLRLIVGSFNDYNRVYPKGKFFLYAYSVPSFIQESNYNTDLRYGINQTWGNFYPNISDPVTWTQPTANLNLINYDNTHYYNLVYSKQNRENQGYVLPPDYSKEKEDCKAIHSNRVIYSLQDNDNNDRFDGNLVFPANQFRDFSKGSGKLSIVRGIDNNRILIIQENGYSVANSYISQQPQEISQSVVSSNTIFNPQIPVQYIKTDLGFGGSQTPAIVSTEYGTYWVDNKRGQIFNFTSDIQDLTIGENQWWFKEFLPFRILRDFPDFDITNNYKFIGMSIVWDARLKRVLFTKRDAEVLPEYKGKITFDGENFIYNNAPILPTNNKYFCNKSFTIAYSPVFKGFISFLTYTPNYYIPNQSYFSSGINYPTSTEQTGLWNHLTNHQSYQCFYSELNPFIVEYSTPNTYYNTVLDSLELKADFRRYINEYDNYVVDTTYNKALIYTPYQTTGTLELIKKQKNNLSYLVNYPKLTPYSKQVLIENVENFYRLNMGLVNTYLNNNQPIMEYQCNPYQTLNPLSYSYKPKSPPDLLRNNYFQVRLINDKYSNYHITQMFIVNDQTKSDT